MRLIASGLFVLLFTPFAVWAGSPERCLDIATYEPSLNDPTEVVVQTRPTPTPPGELFTRPGTTVLIVGNTHYRCDVVDGALACVIGEGLFGTFRVQAAEFGRPPCNLGITVDIDTTEDE